jgi:glyoxylase-like metal-dependent hydrolase (beta-lactamase superfamily II)
LPMAGLKAVNVYALMDETGIDLIDAGMAFGQAKHKLAKAIASIGAELGDVRNFFITHVHRDHYTLAVDLRRDSDNSKIALGAGEQANLVAARALAHGDGSGFLADMRRMGAVDLIEGLSGGGPGDRPASEEWEDPDRWLDDGETLMTRGRKLTAIHTPGHTRGHLVFHDAANGALFAGDHVLPHITPTIGFEPERNRLALKDYLDSLRLILGLPDARLLPAHGPVQDSTHRRVHKLLAHHEHRLGEIRAALARGESTAYEVARSITWTRRERQFADLNTIDQWLATGETATHLDLLVLRGQVTRRAAEDGTDRYEVTREAPA